MMEKRKIEMGKAFEEVERFKSLEIMLSNHGKRDEEIKKEIR